jgi:hypothetical protein
MKHVAAQAESQHPGHRIGYIRVSTVAQTLDQQNEVLAATGVTKVFSDVMSGARDDRPGLAELMAYVREGDTVSPETLNFLSGSHRSNDRYTPPGTPWAPRPVGCARPFNHSNGSRDRPTPLGTIRSKSARPQALPAPCSECSMAAHTPPHRRSGNASWCARRRARGRRRARRGLGSGRAGARSGSAKAGG